MTTDTQTPTPVPLPAADYDALLAWCNERRAERDLPPLDRVPAGRAGDATKCPCAQSAPGLVVDTLAWWWEADEAAGESAELSEALERCIARIDDHGYALVQPVREGGGDV